MLQLHYGRFDAHELNNGTVVMTEEDKLSRLCKYDFYCKLLCLYSVDRLLISMSRDCD